MDNKKFGINLKFKIWDCPGLHTYNTYSNMYFKRANCCLIVFDLNNRESFKVKFKYPKIKGGKIYMY